MNVIHVLIEINPRIPCNFCLLKSLLTLLESVRFKCPFLRNTYFDHLGPEAGKWLFFSELLEEKIHEEWGQGGGVDCTGAGLYGHTLRWFRCVKLAPCKMFAKGKTCSNVGIGCFDLIPPVFSEQQFLHIVWLPQSAQLCTWLWPYSLLSWDQRLSFEIFTINRDSIDYDTKNTNNKSYN